MNRLLAPMIVLFLATPSLGESPPPPTIHHGPHAPAKKESTLDRGRALLAARLRNEPSLDHLLTAASKSVGRHLPNGSQLAHRARRSALLPDLRLAHRTDLERDESLDQSDERADKWGADTDRDLSFQIIAQWRLSRLIYHPDEVAIWRQSRAQAQQEKEVRQQIITLYFDRAAALLELYCATNTTPTDRQRLILRVETLTSRIDALTGGALTRKLTAR